MVGDLPPESLCDSVKIEITSSLGGIPFVGSRSLRTKASPCTCMMYKPVPHPLPKPGPIVTSLPSSASLFLSCSPLL